MPSSKTTLRPINWLLFGLVVLFVVVWQAPAFYTIQGLASYLPLHMFSESFSIIVSMMVFGIAWNVYSKERSGNIVILSCALFAVGLIDFAHMLSFKGMPDFITPSDPEKAINLWLSARLIAALGLLAVALRPWQSAQATGARFGLLGASLVVAVVVIWLGLAYPQSWPRTFIPGQGLTPFKIGAEYTIIAILLIPAVLFYRQARHPQSYDAASLFAASVITILSELSFTLYSDVADIFNLLGHVYKIAAYIFIYRAVFVGSVREPFQRLDAELAENQRITKELRSASLYTRSLIEASLDPLVTISAEGKITDVNRATETATGKSRLELIGTDFSDCFAEPDKAREGYRQAFLKGFVSDYPLVLRHRDGHVANMLYNASVYQNEKGEVLGVFASARDITEHRRAELARSQLAAIVESSNDAIIGKTPDGIITSWNKGAERIYGYSAEETIGRSIEMLASPARHAEIHDLLEVAGKGGMVADHETERVRKDGTVIEVALTLSPIRDGAGRIGGISTIARDITERKRMEQERSQNLGYFESMDKVNRAMQGAKDLEGMLSDVLGVVLGIFDCDRVGLVYPCDPKSPTWQIVMEQSKPGYGTESRRGLLPMTATRAESMQWLLDANGPVQFSPDDDPTMERLENFGIRSFLSTAVYPRTGGAWEFGIHQCTYARVWSPRESRLFEEIGHRLADGLSTMLVYRDLQVSEQRYRQVFENSPVSIWEEDFSDVKALLDGLKQQGVADIDAYFNQHPETLRQCVQLMKVVDVNTAALELHGAHRKEELFAGLADTFTPEAFETLRQELICLWNGGMQMMQDSVVRTMAGELRNVTVYFSVCPGYEGTLGKVIVSLVDITGRKRIEESLKRMNDRFSLASRAAGLGVWDWDIPKNELVWDEGMYALYGIRREDFAGAYDAWLQGVHPDDRTHSDEAIQKALRGEREFDTAFRVRWPDGSIHFIKAYGQIVKDAEGNPLRMTGVNYDITESKRMESMLSQREYEYRTLAENSPDVIVRYDREGRRIYVNPEFERVNHLTSQQVIGKTPAELSTELKPKADEFTKRLMEAMDSGSPVQVDLSLTKDGKPYCWFVRVVPEFDAKGIVTSALTIWSDISERKKAEEEIRTLNLELEQRVAKRTADLEAANQELESFSYSVSHDLRTPLRAIDGFSHILLEDYAGKLDDEGKRLLNTVRDNTSRMGQLIDDILKFSRTGRIEITFSEIDMEKLADSVFIELRPVVVGDKLQIEIEHLPPLMGDRAMMRQVFVNLISNAIKFSGTVENPRIQVGATVKDGETIYYVKDNGVGFDMQYVNKLFGVFQRLHNVNEFEGTGIGLAIVKRIIARHGGRVWAEGKVNAGATIYFSIPAKSLPNQKGAS